MSSLLMGSKRLLVRDDIEGTEGVSYNENRNVTESDYFQM